MLIKVPNGAEHHILPANNRTAVAACHCGLLNLCGGRGQLNGSISMYAVISATLAIGAGTVLAAGRCCMANVSLLYKHSLLGQHHLKTQFCGLGLLRAVLQCAVVVFTVAQ